MQILVLFTLSGSQPAIMHLASIAPPKSSKYLFSEVSSINKLLSLILGRMASDTSLETSNFSNPIPGPIETSSSVEIALSFAKVSIDFSMILSATLFQPQCKIAARPFLAERIITGKQSALRIPK